MTASVHKMIASCHGSANHPWLKFIYKIEIEKIHINIQTNRVHSLLVAFIDYWDGRGKAILATKSHEC